MKRFTQSSHYFHMRMTRTLILTAALLSTACETMDRDRIAVWTGFTHKWVVQNHRVNRIGSFVGNETAVGLERIYEVTHTSASGSAPDASDFATFVLLMRGDRIAFEPDSMEIDLGGTEGDFMSFNQVANIPVVPDRFQDKTRLQAVLSGFDLVAIDPTKAKKLGHLDVSVGEPLPDGTGGFNVPVSGSLQVFCDTPECWPDTNDVKYRLSVHIVVIGGTDTSVAFTTQPAIPNSYLFLPGGNPILFPFVADQVSFANELREALTPTRIASALVLDESGGKTIAVLLKSISIDTRNSIPLPDSSLHLLEWSAYLEQGVRNGSILDSAAVLWYKSWKVDGTVLSLEEGGTSNLSITPLVVQFTGEVLPCSRRGLLPWPGGNLSANTTTAMSTGPIAIHLTDPLVCP